MPIKSQAQRRKFAELLVEGKIKPEAYERWNREAGGAELPERVKPARKSKAPAKKKSARKKTAKKKTAKKKTAKKKATSSRKTKRSRKATTR